MPTLFSPRKIIDPKTGQERIITVEEQEQMLEKGIFFNVPSRPLPKNDK